MSHPIHSMLCRGYCSVCACMCAPVSVAVEGRDTSRLSLVADLLSAGERLEQWTQTTGDWWTSMKTKSRRMHLQRSLVMTPYLSICWCLGAEVSWSCRAFTSTSSLYITSDIHSNYVIIYDSVAEVNSLFHSLWFGCCCQLQLQLSDPCISTEQIYTCTSNTAYQLSRKKYCMRLYLSRSCGFGDFSNSSCNCWESESSLAWRRGEGYVNSDREQYTHGICLVQLPLSVLLYLLLQFCFHFFHVSI